MICCRVWWGNSLLLGVGCGFVFGFFESSPSYDNFLMLQWDKLSVLSDCGCPSPDSSWGCCYPCCTSPGWRTSSWSTSWLRASSGRCGTGLPPSPPGPAAACATRADSESPKGSQTRQTQQLWAGPPVPHSGGGEAAGAVCDQDTPERPRDCRRVGWVCGSLNLLLSDCWLITRPGGTGEDLSVDF